MEMHIVLNDANGNQAIAKFPVITFRKKRLSVAICAHFDLESAKDAAHVKQMIEEAMGRLTEDGTAKVTYTVADL
jgi:hypothetical protein